jgi:DNA mismatch repair ATPase MutS
LNFTENKWQTCEFDNFNDLQSELFKLFPKEVVLEKNLFTDTKIKEILEKKFLLNIYYFEPKEESYKKLTNHF